MELGYVNATNFYADDPAGDAYPVPPTLETW
jgi:hypothetical protein